MEKPAEVEKNFVGHLGQMTYDTGATISGLPHAHVDQSIPLRNGVDPQAAGADGTGLKYYGDRRVKMDDLEIDMKVLNISRALVSDNDIQRTHFVHLDEYGESYAQHRVTGVRIPFYKESRLWHFGAKTQQVLAVGHPQDAGGAGVAAAAAGLTIPGGMAKAPAAAAAAAAGGPIEMEEEEQEDATAPQQQPFAGSGVGDPRPGHMPKEPSAQQRREHESTHIPFMDWCDVCVRSKSRSDHHRAAGDRSEQEVVLKIFQADYSFLRSHPSSYQLTVMHIIDCSVGGGWSAVVPSKSPSQYSQLTYISLLLIFGK
jgi:hypothetical protein